MDVTSPANEDLYDDIELDFDESYDGGVHLHDDEHMLTDGEQARPATATDDMMYDDAQDVEAVAPETDMQDTPELVQQVPFQQEDEELIDYGDEEFHDQQPTEDTAVQDVLEIDYTQQQPDEGALEEVDEEILRHPEEAGVEQTSVVPADSATAIAPTDTPDAQPSFRDESTYADQAVLAGVENPFEVEEDIDQTLVAEPEVDDADAVHTLAAFSAQGYAGDAETLQPPLVIDTAPKDGVDSSADVPGTPTDTGLHPMTVCYGEHTMPLFKSKRQPDGLLKDDNLASLSLAELMRNCRQRLALKTGNVPEEQELTLAFDYMGLLLHEVRGSELVCGDTALTVHQNSRAASEHSLHEVLEVYLQLHHNDGTDDVPPFSITLSHQQFSNQLALLRQAAASGKGMYHFLPGDDEDEQEYFEEEAGDPDVTNVLQEGDGQQQQEYEGGESYVGEEYVQDQDYDDQQYHEEAAIHPTGGGDTFEAAQRPEVSVEAASGEDAAHDGAASVSEQLVYPAAEDESTAGDQGADGHAHQHDGEDHEAARPAQEAHVEVEKIESTTSSQTVQGDFADGEYDEDDPIDWDDEDSSLTSIASELATNDDQNVHSTLSTEDKVAEPGQGPTSEHADDTQTKATGDGQQPPDNTSANRVGIQHAELEDPQQQILASEDFLNDSQDQFGDAGALEREETQGQEETLEHNHDEQADIFDEQQDEVHPSEQEDEEHSAHEFSNGESHEHGAHGLEELPISEADDHEQAAHDSQPSIQDDELYDGYLNGDSYEEEPETYAPQEGQDFTVLDPEDDIGFDDDTTEQHEARKASQHEMPAIVSDSPLGKRSFDQHADADEIDFDEPDTKKVRSE